MGEALLSAILASLAPKAVSTVGAFFKEGVSAAIEGNRPIFMSAVKAAGEELVSSKKPSYESQLIGNAISGALMPLERFTSEDLILQDASSIYHKVIPITNIRNAANYHAAIANTNLKNITDYMYPSKIPSPLQAIVSDVAEKLTKRVVHKHPIKVTKAAPVAPRKIKVATKPEVIEPSHMTYSYAY
jgi:hypothetical protein